MLFLILVFFCLRLPMESEGLKVHEEGSALYNSGNYGEAEVCFRRAAELYRKEKNHEGEHRSLVSIATSLRLQNKWKEALCFYEDQLRPLTMALYTDQSDQYGVYLIGAVECRMQLKHFGEARELADQRCELTKDIHGEESAQHGHAVKQVGDVLRNQGKNAEAMKYYERAKQLLPKNNRSATLNNDMAITLANLGEFERALPLAHEDLEIMLQHHGDQHPAYATSLKNLACLYSALSRFDLAVELTTKALEIRELKLGPNHPKTITIRNDLATFQRAMKDKTFASQFVSNKRMCYAPSCAKGSNDYYYTCSRCRQATYCSETCQHADWPAHEKICIECSGCSGCAKVAKQEQRCRACGKEYCSAACRSKDTEHTRQCVHKRCAGCGKEAEGMQWCSACNKPRYCSKKCQLAHWKAGHKVECRAKDSKRSFCIGNSQ
jgi:tetratricopeptide (TPR) repeat protein